MKGKVLIIEDKELWQIKLRKFLEIDGYFVQVESKLDNAIKLVNKEIFHFITLDMQLDEGTTNAEQYEGWSILKTVDKLRIQDITPVMVITAFSENYDQLKKLKKVEALFFMSKQSFDRQRFLEIVNKQVDRINLRFKNDYRGD